ncbi:hypothetical protein EYF80_026737 [Liparis tanakae]|uniref:Uncharacterized protein n=1 Tax=Liparis tanakae TaxID=230148 RepID=A0A4Z2HB15_9TELE|nr:hypothetical protein EYF80_026737 [Liparis tanakae]
MNTSFSHTRRPRLMAHEVAGRVGVEAERGDDDVGGGVNPVLMVILHPVQHGVRHGGLRVHHLTCRDERRKGTKAVRLVELRVPQHHRILVGHVHLEGVHAVLPHQGLHLVAHLSTGVAEVRGHPHVQSVVAAGLGVGQSAAVLVGVQQGAVLLRQDQRHHHGGTTHQSRLGENLLTLLPNDKTAARWRRRKGEEEDVKGLMKRGGMEG